MKFKRTDKKRITELELTLPELILVGVLVTTIVVFGPDAISLLRMI